MTSIFSFALMLRNIPLYCRYCFSASCIAILGKLKETEITFAYFITFYSIKLFKFHIFTTFGCETSCLLTIF